MINIEEFLFVMIQLAVSYLGFSGVVVALIYNKNMPEDLIQLAFGSILLIPIGIVIYSSIALLLFSSNLGMEKSAQMASGVLGFWLLCIMLFRLKYVQKRSEVGFMTPLGMFFIPTIILVCLGNIFWAKSVLVFVMVCLMHLLVGMMVLHYSYGMRGGVRKRVLTA
jgi:hypothetical protein